MNRLKPSILCNIKGGTYFHEETFEGPHSKNELFSWIDTEKDAVIFLIVSGVFFIGIGCLIAKTITAGRNLKPTRIGRI